MTTLEHRKNILTALKKGYYNSMPVLYHLRPYITNQLVVDCGANRGELSYHFILHGARKVIAYEPNPLMYNLARSISEKIECHNVGLSDESGKSVLCIPYDKIIGGDNDGVAHVGEFNTKLNEIHPDRFNGDCKRIDITLSTLDNEINERPGLIKIDVEGHELQVVRGGDNLIKKYKPALLVEIAWSDNNDIFNYIRNLGYDAYVAYDKEKITKVEKYSSNVYDYLFLGVE